MMANFIRCSFDIIIRIVLIIALIYADVSLFPIAEKESTPTIAFMREGINRAVSTVTGQPIECPARSIVATVYCWEKWVTCAF